MAGTPRRSHQHTSTDRSSSSSHQSQPPSTLHSSRSTSTSTARATSPLSSSYDTSSRYQALQSPSARSHDSRSSSGNPQRQRDDGNFGLPGLPRFHPANYPSSYASTLNTPASSDPTSPRSPEMQQPRFADKERQMQFYQQEYTAGTRHNYHTGDLVYTKPDSPRLVPLGNSGPITPLELEADENHLAAGARRAGDRSIGEEHSRELTNRLVQAAARQRESGHRSSSGSRRDR